jgi:hypothetical protein
MNIARGSGEIGLIGVASALAMAASQELKKA